MVDRHLRPFVTTILDPMITTATEPLTTPNPTTDQQLEPLTSLEMFGLVTVVAILLLSCLSAAWCQVKAAR